jgi:hypothetical protein
MVAGGAVTERIIMNDFHEAPPLAPDRETVAEYPLIADACRAYFAAEMEQLGWSFGNSLLTQSEKWGLIWRADFTVHGRSHPDFINRAVCWTEPDGTVLGTHVAFGQKIAPLP